MASVLSTKKLSGNELHREISHQNDATIKLFVLKNQFTKDKYKVYDPSKNILKEDQFFEEASDAEDFVESTIVAAYVEKNS